MKTSDILVGDKGRAIWAMVVARMWKDAAFKQEFMSNPRARLQEEGIELPDEVEVKILENTDTCKYLTLSRNFDMNTQRDEFVEWMGSVLPINEGCEMRLVQSTYMTRYLVVPQLPKGIQPASISVPELMTLSIFNSVEATTSDTTQSVEAETTEVTVTETSGAQDIEGVTTVVAVAELVAT